MQTSSITSKGQVTIPASIRKSLHLIAGQKVKVSCENNIITITPIENNVSAVSLAEMNKKNELKGLLASWSPLDEDFPEIEDCPPVAEDIF